MVQTTKQQETIQQLKGKINEIYEYVNGQNDSENAEKIKQLAKKLENREYVVAFCGHFSAGKSTMINNVVGENLLPSSPIPTSANLVRVKSGEEYARVFFKSGKPRLYLAPYDYELVKNYCKDGDQIEEIEISHSDSRLPANTVIMDTPGIDSADDAHRIATESAIHLADLVFYVMDYNHVQAELNFLFTKELTEAGKEVYLVINQIDKHNDEELSFSEFQHSVIDSFASWGVKPKRIFYTSLKDKNHHFNEFNVLKKFISEKLAGRDQSLLPSIFQSLKKITQDHIHQARKVEEEKLIPILETCDELSEVEKTELTEMYQKISTELQTISGGVEKTEKDFDYEIAQIMKNAYLMPFQTRELAEAYLESCQKEFKVGFLFSKQKTQEEKDARLGRFYQDMLEKTKSQLEWHLREYLIGFLKDTGLEQPELLARAQSLSIHFPADLLINVVKPGARLSGEYVLYYTDDVANEIKKMARNQITEIKSLFLNSLKEETSKLQKQYEKEYKRLEQYVLALEGLEAFQQNFSLKEKEIDRIFSQQVALADDPYHLFQQEEEEFEVVHGMFDTKPIQNQTMPDFKQTSVVEVSSLEETRHEEGQLQNMVERLDQTSSLIHDLPGFKKLAKDLVEKAERLDNKGFTVALFGAFSAGKSSFANALMGEKVLPVSPNPTTAAINKIKPVSENNHHGKVLVKFKEEAAMLEDVNRSLRVFDVQAITFAEAKVKIDQIFLQKDHEGVLEKTHFTFLQAFKNGYESFVELLGTVLETEINEFSEFVAKEEKSCYVEWIELYYDCELTRKGITLVDTPGADSINARHTGVAFDYIKNSDAILFVTYYNHAFSKADREFLIQLGRVKEAFQLDKMFFIINAIDLAENEEEKETVSDYVKEQLLKYGIRNPHLHSLSSLLALKEKKQPSTSPISGLTEFEKAFNQFIANDLTLMALSSAGNELKRVHELVNKLVLSSKEDKTVKEEIRSTIEKQKTMIHELIKEQTVDRLRDRLFQEAEELIYYIKQRVFLRFADFFKEAFNPSTLRDDGRNLKKALQAALEEFIESLGFDFAQEMRATTLRLDRFAEKILVDYQSVFLRSLREMNNDLSFAEFEMNHEGKIDFPLAFKNVNTQIFTKAMSYFKNPKSFFEKNEKKLMSDELNHVLSALASDYLQIEAQNVKDHYTNVLSDEFNRLLSQIDEEKDDFYVSLLSAIDGGVPIERLVDIQQRLEEYL